MKNPFLAAIPLLSKIESAGFEAYFVGGAVRDCLLGKKIEDVDIATSATPAEMKRIFPKTIDVGIEHGTVIVLFNGIPYEVTTFRSEAEYIDFRKPSEVQFIRSLEEDLQRRDFTMNAIAMNKDGNFIDPFNGRKAIEDKVIQTVGKAEERFSEDALRMMRALRFFSQLDFVIEKETYAALASLAHLLENISVERKLVEFEKLLIGKNRKKALLSLTETGLYKYLPNLSSFQQSIYSMLNYDYHSLSLEEMWCFLLYQFDMHGNDRIAFLKSWKMPTKKIKSISSIGNWLHYRLEKNWTDVALYTAGLENVKSAENILNVIKKQNKDDESFLLERYELLPIKQRSELQVTGNDLQAWFQRKQGPWIKETLDKVEIAVINHEVKNETDSIREWLFGCNQR
ncbi:CCA tRNA nucleotidyltransferase [Bacillus sp. Bva_UNVM-123]|uniref:CCA tRNA nucleotidyltransferase n=1 Tax=Bacillus sp. Bva_UNVM-123 TaxID=2829798 RepID=UPI00391EF5AC